MNWTDEQLAEWQARQAEIRAKLANQFLRQTVASQPTKKTGKRPPKRAITPKTGKPIRKSGWGNKFTLGEWRSLEFFIPRWMPSFKNSKMLGRAGKNGRATTRTNPRYKAIMNAATNDMVQLAQANHLRYPLTNVSYKLHFHVSNRRQDPDGAEATVMDCLQHAGILRGDSFAHIVACEGHDHRIVPKGAEGVRVSLRGQEWVPE